MTNLLVSHCYASDQDKKPEDYPWINRLKLKPIKECRPSWYKNLSRHIGEDQGTATQKFCPSTTNFMNEGFVVCNPADLFIRRDETDHISLETQVEDNFHIEHHPLEQFGEGYPFDDGFIPHSFKFNSFWSLKANKSTTMIILPCWWDPSYNFVRAFHGMVHLSEEVQPLIYQINTKIRLPEPNTSLHIKADTPLAHIFFVDVPRCEIQEDFFPQERFDAQKRSLWHRTAIFSKEYFSDYLRSFLVRSKK